VAVRPNVISPPVPGPMRRQRATVDAAPSRPGTDERAAQGDERRDEPLDAEATATGATPGHGASGWGGIAILFVPAVGVLGMVGAVVVVNEVNSWWVLVLAMLLALIATASVMATVMRMLAD